MAARVTRTMASFGCSIRGMSFSWTRTLYGPRYTIARMCHLSTIRPLREQVPVVDRCETGDGGHPRSTGSVLRRCVELQIVALGVLERNDAAPLVVADSAGEIDALGLELLHLVLDAAVGLEAD